MQISMGFQVAPILFLPFRLRIAISRRFSNAFVKDERGREPDARHWGGASNCHD